MVDQNDQNSAGNDSRENIEKTVFEGHEILLRKDESGQYEIDPQEAPQEVIDKLNNGEATKLIASLNKKNFDSNKERQELEDERKRIDLERRELEILRKEKIAPQPQSTSKEKTFDDYLMEVFGTSDNDQLALIQAENPKDYIQKTAKVQRLMSGSVSYADLELIQRQSVIDSQIISQGYDPSDVEAFMRSSSITDKGSAFNLYKQLNQKQSSPNPANLRSNVQDNAPKVLTSGSLKKQDNEAKKREALKDLARIAT